MNNKALNASQYTIELSVGPETERLPVVIRKHPRSRHMVIRYEPLQHHIALTLPRYVTIKQGLHFVEEKRKWIERQIKDKAERIPFDCGQPLTLLGKNYTLAHIGGRGVVRIEGERIVVPGEAEFMRRRVREWLKKYARDEITKIAAAKAEIIKKTPGKVSVRDTRSRWGSCSPDGSLSFSWRLAFAPYEVLEYVVCHEVAHLLHHNHGPAFWQVTAFLCPEHEKARQWLRSNGASLHAYG
jgi:predicted metal-dependent hydrolase